MTPQTQFTPGPWSFRNTGTSIAVFGRNGSEQVCCNRNTPVDEANARLIAAAPSLHAALHALLEFAEQYGPSERASYADWSGYLKDARKALDLGSSTPR